MHQQKELLSCILSYTSPAFVRARPSTVRNQQGFLAQSELAAKPEVSTSPSAEFHLAAAPRRQQLPLHTDSGWVPLLSRWKRPVYNQCCNANTPKGKGILSMSFRCLKDDKIMQYTLKMRQYVTPLNFPIPSTTLFPNTAYIILSKTGIPLLSSPALGSCTPSRGCTNWKDKSSARVISAQQIGDHGANERHGIHQHQIYRSKHGSFQQVLSAVVATSHSCSKEYSST